MTYQVEVNDRPAQLTLGVHTHSAQRDLPRIIPQELQGVIGYLNKTGRKPTGVPFVGYTGMDMENLNVEIGFLCTEPIPGDATVQPSQIPGGRAASVLHKGTYKDIGNGHMALHDWMESKGYESATGYYELYLNDPGEVPEDQLETLIFTLIK
jgi:effector-binding domain-containing protein